MDQFRLNRGGTTLGFVTRGDWDGQQASWPDWGRLDPAEAFASVSDLLIKEGRLHDEAVETELAGGDPAPLLAEAARLQIEFMRPGVALVSLADGKRIEASEFHIDDGRVFWR